MKMKHIIPGVVFIALCAVPGDDACGRRRCPPRDRTPPVVTCPPNINQIADPFQVNAKITYPIPTANDNRDGPITPTLSRGLPSGYLFSEGIHWIKYSAKDSAKNVGTCQFYIRVTVVRCPRYSRQTDGWKICHPSTDMKYGGYCRFGCYPGHELIGSSYSTCKSTGQWTVPNQPYCRQRTCDQLFPDTDQGDKVSITCTDSNNYRSICTYNCVEGYSVMPGRSKVRVCGATGQWVGNTPVCHDTSPPEFTNCPDVKTAYAEPSNTSGRVYWDEVQAIDNSGDVTVVQTSEAVSGTDLDVGEHYVTYTATDPAGNSATCQFKVVVKQIRCPTIYPLPYTSVTCPTGRILGSICEFACDNGTSTNLSLETKCEKQGTTYHYALWNFGNHQPYCEQTSVCPDLRSPDNGALACDIWQYGRYCQMLCQNGYTVNDFKGSKIHQGLVVCGDSGVWHISDEIPDCVEAASRAGTEFVGDVKYHYEGPCVDAIDEIKEKFLLNNQAILECNPPECSVNNVEVICGQSLKRDTSSEISIRATIKVPGQHTFSESNEKRQEFKNNINSAMERGDLDLVIGNETIQAQSADISPAQVICPDGSAPDGKLNCARCAPGQYQDASVVPSVCSKCVIGWYQDESGQTSCKQCETGWTTEKEGARQCKEACPVGTYSLKGTIPCDPCDIGYYADTPGTREQCTPCSGSKTTNKTGSTSSAMCYDFDLEFFRDGSSDGAMAAVPVDISTTQALSLNMWLKCSSCYDILNITDENGVNYLSINGSEIKVGSNAPSSAVMTLSADRWSYLYITMSSLSVKIYLDGVSVTTETSSAPPPPTLYVTPGDGNYIGRISQLNLQSGTSTARRRRSASPQSTCFTDNVGDLLPWQTFSGIDGTFVVTTRSTCDAFDNCASTPCQNSGECFDAIDWFTCTCAEGFTGHDCSDNIDDCADGNSCDNGGTCMDDVNSFKCNCPAGYSGDLCQIKVVDGQWSDYGNWSLCSTTCGLGHQIRNRTCDNPEPSNGGMECDGDSFEIKSCQIQECINECINDLDPLENGTLNCTSYINNVTRKCYPFCNDGHAFDSDLNVDPANVFCGPESGNTWNIESTDKLPSCQRIDECYNLLTTVVNELNDLVNAQGFTVNYGGGSYDVTVNSTSLDGTTVCQDGYVPVFYYCVACGPGMYQSGEFCYQCPAGYYQDESAQLNCKHCPEDWTTADIQSRDVSYCNVEVPSESTDTLNYVVMGVAISTGVVAIVLVILGVCFWKKKCKPQWSSGAIDVQEPDQPSEFYSNSNLNNPGPPPYHLFQIQAPPPPYSPKKAFEACLETDEFASPLATKESGPL